MEYDDEKILNATDYESMAKAYSAFFKQKGFIIVKIDDKESQELINKTMTLLSQIKLYLFRLGGRFNTSKLYALTDRQAKKLEVIFDTKLPAISNFVCHDKTKCFFKYLSIEFELIKNLIALKEQSNFESDIFRIINDRLLLLQNIFGD